MKKLRLDVDALQVESFDAVTEGGGARGSVEARGATIVNCSYQYGCNFSLESGQPGCPCANSGEMSCVWCIYETASCGTGCSWTAGGGEICYV